MIDIMKLLINGVTQGAITTLNLIILLIIMIFLSVVLYKNTKPFKIIYNFVVNTVPKIKRQHVLFVNFSKQEGAISNIHNKYVEAGCKKYILNKNKIVGDQKVSENLLKEIIQGQQKTIKAAKDRMKNADSFIYAGFPHVPLGFLDGYNFTDSDTPILYEHQHADTDHRKKGFFELEKIYNSDMKLVNNLNEAGNFGNEVALKVEQSFIIDDNGIKELLGDIPIIYLSSEKIGRSGVSNYSQIDIYKKEFERALDELRKKGVNKIHLFATTPASLTFSLGSVIKHYHPEIIVYNFNNGNYDWAINLRTKDAIEINKKQKIKAAE